MALLLHIDTTSNICSVSLSNKTELLVCCEDTNENSHAAVLTSIIKNGLERCGLKIEELDAICFSCGPGSYTGLRIGLSTAKGICYALQKPLVFVNTLEALADQMIQIHKDEEAIYWPMIDARRTEVYTLQKNYTNKTICNEQAILLNNIPQGFINEGVRYIVGGNGKKKAQSLYNNKMFIYSEVESNSSTHMIRLSYERFKASIFEQVAYCEPNYLKAPFIK